MILSTFEIMIKHCFFHYDTKIQCMVWKAFTQTTLIIANNSLLFIPP